MSRPSEPAIEMTGLRKTYSSHRGTFRRTKVQTVALDGIDLAIQPGELYGLLGPNGAGKTTTVKILTTLLLPDSGTARVLGLDVVKQTDAVRRRIGFVFGGERGLYWRLSGLDNLRYFADLYRIPPDVSRRRIAELIERLGLSGRERDKVEIYSRGMKQRLHLARGLLNDPEVLFLDEPTIGLSVREESVREVLGGAEEALLKEFRPSRRPANWSPAGDQQLQRVDQSRTGPVEIGGTVQDNHAPGANALDAVVHVLGFHASACQVEAARCQDQELRSRGCHVAPIHRHRRDAAPREGIFDAGEGEQVGGPVSRAIRRIEPLEKDATDRWQGFRLSSGSGDALVQVLHQRGRVGAASARQLVDVGEHVVEGVGMLADHADSGEVLCDLVRWDRAHIADVLGDHEIGFQSEDGGGVHGVKGTALERGQGNLGVDRAAVPAGELERRSRDDG